MNQPIPASSGDSVSSPHLADAISARLQAILAHARSASPGGLDMEAALRAVAACLRTGSSPPPAFSISGTSARELLEGYHLLRQAVMDQVADALHRDLHTRETNRLNASLDAMMNQHVAAAVEHQLAELRAVAEAQGKHMSFLSHDLRGSLNGIMLMLEVLRREMVGRGEPPETLEDILLMRRSITDAVAMMERHVQADRLRRGQIAPAMGVVPLRPLLEDLVAALPAKAKAAARVDVPENAAVRGDPALVRQALHNLLDNAVRHGGGAMRIQAVRDGGEWSTMISDKGPGMDNERLQRWLDPLRRIETKDRGMGLQIAFHAARLMHGRLEGEGAPGRGLTMRLILPAATDDSSAARTGR